MTDSPDRPTPRADPIGAAPTDKRRRAIRMALGFGNPLSPLQKAIVESLLFFPAVQEAADATDFGAHP